MSRAARVSAFVAFLVLMAIGLFNGDDPRVITRTSFGQIPEGHAALYALLAESGVPVARSYAVPDQLAPGRTIWWIEPDALAGSDHPPSEDPIAAADPQSGDSVATWIAAGGTAIVWMPASAGGMEASELVGIPAPATQTLAAIEAPPADAAPDAAPDAGKRAPTPRVGIVRGAIASGARAIELEDPVAFVGVDAERWRVVAELDGHPFVIETALGVGRLVVIADARFVSNAWLDHADAAPLAADLVRAYGDPWIDEHDHGLVASRSATAYLLRSPALAFFIGLALLAAAFAWFGAALPPRSVREHDPSAPTLEDFVASMAQMYAMTRDHPRVLGRYRELTARRLRRHLGLPPDAPIEGLAERLARRRGVSAVGLQLLSHGASVRNEVELERAAAALDQLVREVA